MCLKKLLKILMGILVINRSVPMSVTIPRIVEQQDCNSLAPTMRKNWCNIVKHLNTALVWPRLILTHGSKRTVETPLSTTSIDVAQYSVPFH